MKYSKMDRYVNDEMTDIYFIYRLADGISFKARKYD